MGKYEYCNSLFYVVLMVMTKITKIHGFQLQSCAEASQITQNLSQWNVYRQCQILLMDTVATSNSLNEYTALTLI